MSVDPTAAIAEFKAEFIAATETAIGGRSIRSIAAAAGISHPTLLRILAGKVLPDVATIIRLETVLDVNLWPRQTR